MYRWPWFCRGPRWFRIKGWGVRYVDHRRHSMLFGERNGYQRALHIGPHCFRWITPDPRPPASHDPYTCTDMRCATCTEIVRGAWPHA